MATHGPEGPEARGVEPARWHAPPRPRAPFGPPPSPPAEPRPPGAIAAPRGPRVRLAPALLTLALLLLIGVAAWPALYAAVVHPPPVPPTTPPTPMTFPRAIPRSGDAPASCFADLTFAPTATPTVPPAVGPEAAEAAIRADYDLPFRKKRLGTRVDARLVTLGYVGYPVVGPAVRATRAAATQGRVAWLLAFSQTPALDDPVPVAASATAYALYALLDAATGDRIAACEAVGAGATAASGPLPATPAEGEARLSLEAARAAVDFPARVAGWLPFAPTDRFARVERLSGGRAAAVADYIGADDGRGAARVRVISTTAPPLLATAERGGTAVALATGGAARFDDLATLQILTWREGDAWYQLVAARPREHGPSYTVADLLAIAAELR
jgi:hypothetical protein